MLVFLAPLCAPQASRSSRKQPPVRPSTGDEPSPAIHPVRSWIREYGGIMVASCMASATQKFALYPLDTLKTQLQYSSAVAKGAARPQHLVATALSLVRGEGPRALYRGIIPTLAGVVPVALVYMPSYELSKQMLGSRFGPYAKVGAGSIAGLASTAVRLPTTVMKSRLQMRQYKGFVDGVRSMARDGGWYTGWQTVAVLDVSYSTVQFAVLEQLKRAGGWLANGRSLKPQENAVIGMLTGVAAAAFTEPLDVVKTRLHTQRQFGGPQAGAAFGYTGLVHGLAGIVKQEGLPTLWRGLAPRLLTTATGSAIWLSTYEAVRRRLAPEEQAHKPDEPKARSEGHEAPPKVRR